MKNSINGERATKPQLTDKQFAQMADPHAWLLVADNLHSQAVRTRESASGELLIRIVGDIRDSWDVTERATILLAAFALENAIKAFLVYENPNWISNGRISKQLKSHNLHQLRSQSALAPNRNRFSGLLKFLDDGIGSWARYPCALSSAETNDLPHLTDQYWNEYRRLMSSYGRKLTTLLGAGWNGPHGHYGTWDCITMNFLQEPVRSLQPVKIPETISRRAFQA